MIVPILEVRVVSQSDFEEVDGLVMQSTEQLLANVCVPVPFLESRLFVRAVVVGQLRERFCPAASPILTARSLPFP